MKLTKLLLRMALPYLACVSCQTKNNLFEQHRQKEVVEIALSNYGLEEIPSDIGELENIRQLTISMDPLKDEWVIYPPASAFNNRERKPPFYSLPKEITQLKKLEKLSIIELNIHVLPEDLEKLENLEQLNLSHNKLTLSAEVEKIIKLKKLKTLYFFGNKFDSASLALLKKARPDLTLPGLEDADIVQ